MIPDPRDILSRYGIDTVAKIALTPDLISRPHKLARAGFDADKELYAIIFAIPYFTEVQEKNLSAYAVSRDYHLFFKELFDAILPEFRREYPKYSFSGFADDSPIDERMSAAVGGLGVIGKNRLLITEKYSSYVFLGEIITDMPLETVKEEIRQCEGCGRCERVCPMSECGICLSALTQKKGSLSDEEKQLIKKYGSVWGCDRCQEVCPHTQRAIADKTIFTHFAFFKENSLPHLTLSDIDKMSDEEFDLRAYSWRKRDTIRRNLLIFEDPDGECSN